MRAVAQRVTRASVEVGGDTVAEIGIGLLVLVGVGHDDTSDDARVLADKLVGLRVFRDDEGAMNRSVADVGGSILVVSQFTLLADLRKGRRPSFVAAGDPERARALVDEVASSIAGSGVGVGTGVFGAAMGVHLVNDGPVTIVMEVVDGKVV